MGEGADGAGVGGIAPFRTHLQSWGSHRSMAFWVQFVSGCAQIMEGKPDGKYSIRFAKYTGSS